MYSRPAEPMPHGRPRLAPFFVVQLGPLGPSLTYGMRSFIAADAFVVKRSGGSQQRSTWQSAEMTSYFMMVAPLTRSGGAFRRFFHAKGATPPSDSPADGPPSEAPASVAPAEPALETQTGSWSPRRSVHPGHFRALMLTRTTRRRQSRITGSVMSDNS